MTLRANCVAVLAAVTALLAPLPAGAQPPEPAPSAPPAAPAADEVSLTLPALGMGSSLAFPGPQHEVSLTVPVLPGLAPTALVASVQLPPFIARGTLEATVGERLLSRVELPLQRDAAVRIPLAGAEIENNAIAVRLRSALVPETGTCVTDWLGRPLTLSNPAVVYSGREVQPTTVADFLPPVLDRLTVYVPERLSEVESAAALALSSAVVARYGAQPVTVDLRAVAPGAPVPDHAPGFLERQIAIVESNDTGLRMSGGASAPLLTLSGSRATLPDQMRLLTSDLAQIAISSGAVAVALPAAPQLAPEASTLQELGETQLSATSFGTVSVDIGVDQTRLGRPTRNLRIRLLGNYTPLPQTMNGQLTVTAGGKQIDSWAVEASGRIERVLTIPDSVLSRYTSLTVALHQSGLTHGCGLEQPITLTIDPASGITGTAARPPVPAGFQSLPQALLPNVQIGLRTPGFDDTKRAVRILVGLQRLTAVPLRPELAPFDKAAQGRLPAILVAADGAVPPSITLPLSASGDTVTVHAADTGAELRIDPMLPHSSLQTARIDGRTVLVAASTGTPEQLDGLLDWLEADGRRWARLTGTVLYQAGDREPRYFDPAEAFAAEPAPEPVIPIARVLTIAGVLALVLGLLFGLLILVRRKREE
ncbi:hypothetical protein [Nocardia sp. NPDC051832]|uniref:hypothetical protein n=1 Tax=Nocardia sp. NPDC051832 TaxID=3155673 RepID=UPI003430574D